MREIKFRGKRADNGEWVYGYLSRILGQEQGDTVIVDWGNKTYYIVTPETIGQFTGAYDAGNNGKEVFEGDIIQNCDNDLFQEVYYDEDRYAWYCRYIYDKRRLVSLRESLGNLNKVLGNIHDNPELIK